MTTHPEVTTRTYTVEGMTCDHCVTAITGEVTGIPGISDVSVDLSAKTVTVSGTTVEDAAVRSAVDEAGYTVVG
jgi:copper chaperone